MARLFSDESSQYLSNGAAIVTAAPITFAAWAYPDEDKSHTIIACSDTAGDTDYFRLGLRPSGSGTTVIANTRSGAGSTTAATTDTYTLNAWNHCAAVFAAVDDRRAFLNGANRGNEGTSRTPAGIDFSAIGETIRLNPLATYFSGRIAEAAIWNATLIDEEIASLATGISPLAIRPQSLVAYWPLMGNLSPEIDIVGGYDMTLNAAPTKAAHPPVFYPAAPMIHHVPTAGIAALNVNISKSADYIQVVTP